MLLDSSAWIELFIKGEKWQRVRDVIRGEECQISIVSLAEISDKLLHYGHSLYEVLPAIESNCDIVEIDKETSMVAGGLNFRRKKISKGWGMMDSFVLATAMLNDWRILTKDKDFADLDNVEML